jgi:hypothetical protein
MFTLEDFEALPQTGAPPSQVSEPCLRAAFESYDDENEQTLFTGYLDLWALLLSPFRNSSTAFRLNRTRRPMRTGFSRRDRTSFHNVVREI